MAVGEPKVCAWIHAKFVANSFERGHIVFVLFLSEVRVIPQRTDSLDSSHCEKDAGRCEIDVELKKSPQLRLAG